MKRVTTIADLQVETRALQSSVGIGFVPTMGALHEGHLSLVRRAVAENGFTVVSIFVNPAQFNDPGDLERYPRNLEADMALLSATDCNLVFAPDVKEIYPEPDKRRFSFGSLGEVMEGQFRPGHFNGVAQVVSRLFEIVKPHKAYFGLKDFQQLAIIKSMVKQLQLPVEIVPCAIVREENGLAMSSRNKLLSTEQRENAAVISKTLLKVKELSPQKSVTELKCWATGEINKNPFLETEYFEIVDTEQLQPVKNWEEAPGKIACIAVYCGKIRLIDNILL
ncbi:MAG: pantoate--beta-alanine ligase [Draconibacterium sp.]